MHDQPTTTDPQEFWDELYGARDQITDRARALGGTRDA